VTGSAPVQMLTLWVLQCRCFCGSQVPQSPPDNFRTSRCFPGGSCWAAGCPAKGHSSPTVSLFYPGSPWRRHLGAKAMALLLGSCTWADAMVPRCPSLGGGRWEKAVSLPNCSLNLNSSALSSIHFLLRGTPECAPPPAPSSQHSWAQGWGAEQLSSLCTEGQSLCLSGPTGFHLECVRNVRDFSHPDPLL